MSFPVGGFALVGGGERRCLPVRGGVACCVYVEGAGQDVTGPVAEAFLKTLSA
ncbi:hypothetical protein GCM10009827_028630 [Dactylosporangium maewongense]|uniref:Uncharacterized protein n=1 Tax=Dactylosporangium maewongense TaxID=634393 RepID=A0ABN2A6S2_9ACTN